MIGISKTWFFLLSLGLNASFVGAWLAHTLPAKVAPVPEPCCPLMTRLGAGDNQSREVTQSLATFRDNCRKECTKLDQVRAELIDLIAAPEPNRSAIEAKQKEVLEGQRQIQKLVVDELMATKALLTPEQQCTLFSLIRTRCCCMTQEPPSPAPPGTEHGSQDVPGDIQGKKAP